MVVEEDENYDEDDTENNRKNLKMSKVKKTQERSIYKSYVAINFKWYKLHFNSINVEILINKLNKDNFINYKLKIKNK